MFGSIAGVLIAFCANLISAPWGLMRGLGLPASLALGAVLGCMLGTLIGCMVGSVLSVFPHNVQAGRLSGNKVALAVQVLEQSSEKNAVIAIMQEFGAVMTVEAEGAAEATKRLSR
jgi:hypothetical protein